MVVHRGRSKAVDAASQIREQLASAGVDTVVLGDDGTRVESPACDLVVSVGGDGTFLRGAYATTISSRSAYSSQRTVAWYPGISSKRTVGSPRDRSSVQARASCTRGGSPVRPTATTFHTWSGPFGATDVA